MFNLQGLLNIKYQKKCLKFLLLKLLIHILKMDIYFMSNFKKFDKSFFTFLNTLFFIFFSVMINGNKKKTHKFP